MHISADTMNHDFRRSFMFRKIKAVFGVTFAAVLLSSLLFTGCQDSPDEPITDMGGGNFCC